jgi:hypothetical protein
MKLRKEKPPPQPLPQPLKPVWTAEGWRVGDQVFASAQAAFAYAQRQAARAAA